MNKRISTGVITPGQRFTALRFLANGNIIQGYATVAVSMYVDRGKPYVLFDVNYVIYVKELDQWLY